MHWLAALLCSWAIPSCIAQQVPLGDYHSSSPLNEAFESKVNWALERYKVPGIAVSVVRGDDIFAKGYGASDISGDVLKPVTEHTLFEGGSTSKAFTAAAVSLLVDDNENFPDIQWDTPVHDILPEFVLEDPWATAHVTIEDILSHRSGSPRHDWIFNANITSQEAVSKLRYVPLTAPIRTKWQYSNMMFVTAGLLVEKRTGQSLKEFLRSRIWEPLNMTETYLSPVDAQAAGEDIAQGYYWSSENQFKDAGNPSLDNLRGAGNVLSSATDYAKWLRAMIHRRPPLSPAGHAAVTGAHSIVIPQVLAPYSAPTLYGFGWNLQSYKGHAVVQHGGAIWGFGALALFLPDIQLGITIFGNNMVPMGIVSFLLAYHIIDETLEIPEEDRFNWKELADGALNHTIFPPPETLYPKLPDTPLPPPLPLSNLTGIYTHPAYPTLNLTTDCTHKSILPPLTNSTQTLRLCSFVVDGVDLPPSFLNELVHVSGDHWVFGFSVSEMTLTMRAEFRVGADGLVGKLGIEADDMMAGLKEKIWWVKSR